MKLRVVLSDQVPAGTMLATPTTLHNIGVMLKIDQDDVLATGYLVRLCGEKEVAGRATTARLDLVNSDLAQELSLEDVDKLLQNYFQADRYMVKNSYLCLDVSVCLTTDTCHIFHKLHKGSVLFFLVTLLAGEGGECDDGDLVLGMLVSRSVTSVYQGANVNMSLPRRTIEDIDRVAAAYPPLVPLSLLHLANNIKKIVKQLSLIHI